MVLKQISKTIHSKRQFALASHANAQCHSCVLVIPYNTHRVGWLRKSHGFQSPAIIENLLDIRTISPFDSKVQIYSSTVAITKCALARCYGSTNANGNKKICYWLHKSENRTKVFGAIATHCKACRSTCCSQPECRYIYARIPTNSIRQKHNNKPFVSTENENRMLRFSYTNNLAGWTNTRDNTHICVFCCCCLLSSL